MLAYSTPFAVHVPRCSQLMGKLFKAPEGLIRFCIYNRGGHSISDPTFFRISASLLLSCHLSTLSFSLSSHSFTPPQSYTYSFRVSVHFKLNCEQHHLAFCFHHLQVKHLLANSEVLQKWLVFHSHSEFALMHHYSTTYVSFSRAFEVFVSTPQAAPPLISSAVSSSPENMVSNRLCICWHKYIRMIIYLLTLFVSTSIFTQKDFMAEGRAIPTLTEAPKRGMEEQGLVKESKAQIGSRPPRCEGRCTSCGRCEAVQVPVIPQVQSHRRTRTTRSATRAIPHSRSDDLSNYKPMSWKCKCGNYFFNP